ncbi:MAG: hypothetical protein HQK51_13170 [Oligoflexia bacterium]|nr:hypothetical protein [Oligoflexia bacterium]
MNYHNGKKYSILFFLTFFFCFFTLFLHNLPQSQAEGIPISMAKGTHSIFKEEYQPFFSPLVGMSYSDQVKNYYKFGNENDSFVKLIREMYYESDPVTIAPSDLKGAKHLGPAIIGKINAELFSLIQKDGQPLKDLLDSKNKKGRDEYLDKLKKMIKKDPFVKNSLANDSLEYKKLKKELLDLPSIQGLSPEEKKKKEAEISRKMKKFNANMAEQDLMKLPELILSVLKESIVDKKYPTENIFKVFTNLLWKKINSKKDLIPYFQAMTAVPSSFAQKTDGQQSTWELSKRQEWLEQAFEAKDIIRDLNKVMELDSEKIFFHLDLYKKLPLHRFTTISIPEYNKSFINCGENSLLNFFNLLLYDKKNKSFDYKMLEKLKDEGRLNVSEQLIQFYKKYPSFDLQNSPEALKAWAKMLCGLPGVDYSDSETSPGCSIKGTGATNMLSVIKNLISPVKDWNELFLKLKASGSNSEIDSLNVDKTDYGKLFFKLNSGNNSEKYKWNFDEGHFFIDFFSGDKEVQAEGESDSQMNVLFKAISNKYLSSHFFSSSPSQLEIPLQLLSCIEKKALDSRYIPELIKSFPLTIKDDSLLRELILLNDLNSSKDKAKILSALMERNTTPSKELNELVNKLFSSLDSEDKIKVLESIISQKSFSWNDFLASEIKKLSAKDKTKLFPSILYEKLSTFYDLITPQTISLASENDRVMSVLQIVKSNIPSLFPLVTYDNIKDESPFMKRRIAWTIINKQHRELYSILKPDLIEAAHYDAELITKIINQKIVSLYPILLTKGFFEKQDEKTKKISYH